MYKRSTMIHSKLWTRLFFRDSRAVSTAVSTVILTGTIVSLLCVTTIYVNSFIWAKTAESDYNSARQFMQTIGLQIDDVAWTTGRKATVRYSSAYGSVSFLPSALNYTVYVKTEGSPDYQFLASETTGVLLYNMPVSKYSLYDGYYELLYPASADNLTVTGTSAPLARVFGVEKLTPSMSDGSFVRVVVAPAVRSLFSSMTTESGSTFYTRLYLPFLKQGDTGGLHQSVTLAGSLVTAFTQNRVTSVKVTVGFPEATSQQGFDGTFFNFPVIEQIFGTPVGYSDSQLELYVGEVEVDLGVHS
jgi:hypothetical protein